MTLFFHELRQNRISLIVWSAILSFIIAVSIVIYPEMSSELSELGGMFSEMGGFSEAFGMTELNFGEFIGYFGVECGNSFGLGGAFFAAILGITALAKEERDRTAEFLLTQPISRSGIVTEKLLAVIAQIAVLDASVLLVSIGASAVIGETESLDVAALILLSHFLLQIEIAAVTFGISAFIKRNGMGIGIGVAAIFYFINIIANLTEELEALKYLTPFGYTESAYIINNSALHLGYLAVGALFAAIGIVLAFARYTKKDIAS